jgi:hypothetical protein
MDFLESLYLGRLLYRYILPGRRKVSDKSCRGNQNTHFVANNFFPRKSRPVQINYEKYRTRTIKANLVPSTVIEFAMVLLEGDVISARSYRFFPRALRVA